MPRPSGDGPGARVLRGDHGAGLQHRHVHRFARFAAGSAPSLGDEQPKLLGGAALRPDGAKDPRIIQTPFEDCDDPGLARLEDAGALLRLVRLRDMFQVDDRQGAERVLKPVPRLVEPAELVLCRDHHDRRLLRRAHRSGGGSEDHHDQEREEGTQEEQQKGAREHRRREVAAGDDEGGSDKLPH